jgi:hypothetical protein
MFVIIQVKAVTIPSLSKTLKIRIYKATLLPVVLYGYETQLTAKITDILNL